MDKDNKKLYALRKGKAEERIATALEHIAFYLGVIVNSDKFKLQKEE